MRQKLKIHDHDKCPECNSTNLEKDSEHGELICLDCGIVIDENMIDYGPEWRAYDSEQYNNRARTGSPMNELIFDKGLSTSISWQNKDHYGNAIPKRNRAQMYRLRKWHKRMKIRNGYLHGVKQAIQHISRVSSIMNLPRSVRENAVAIYRKAAKDNLIRGRSIEIVAIASIYAGCRQCNIPRTLDEISNASKISKKEIGRNYRHIAKELPLKLLPTHPHDYINRFINQLNLSEETNQKARELVDTFLKDKKNSGSSPTSIAAAAIYVASILCGEKRTQDQISKIANVTEVTIRNQYKKMVKLIDLDIAI
jgi:transcription initiation factor TFIIB